MRLLSVFLAASLACGIAAAQALTEPPPIIRIVVEMVKPGKGAAHERAETSYVRALAKAKYPGHYLALTGASGPTDAWFIEGYESFAALEKADQAGEAPMLKADLEQVAATDGEYLNSSRSMIAVYRKDLSYHPDRAVSMLPKARYIQLLTIRLRLGTEKKLVDNVKTMFSIYEKAQMQWPSIVYQTISGSPAGTYLIFEPFTTLSEWDKYPMVMKAVREAAGGTFDEVEKTFAEITTFEEGRLMQPSPKMSYVSKEFAEGDKDFWMPRPKPAAKPKAEAKGTN